MFFGWQRRSGNGKSRARTSTEEQNARLLQPFRLRSTTVQIHRVAYAYT